MEILGQGHKGIALADSLKVAKKFYLSESEGQREQAHLALLADMQQKGFSISCVIPRLVEVIGAGTWELGNKTYHYCIRMERVAGSAANLVIPDLTKQELEILGRDLGNVIFALHHNSKRYENQWKPVLKGEDRLLAHILDEKRALVQRDSIDQSARAWTQDAASYLENQREILSSERVLSHQDLSLPNIIVGDDSHVNGLVDWFGLGPTSASLSLYQLAPMTIWPYVRQQYIDNGGVIGEDIVYAAAVIHLAWAPIICRQLGIQLDESETRKLLGVMHTNFKSLVTEKLPPKSL